MNELKKKLQLIVGSLPAGVEGTRAITLVEGDVLKCIAGAGPTTSSTPTKGGGKPVYCK